MESKVAWSFPTASFQQERKRRSSKKTATSKGYATWMSFIKGGPGSGNFGHCGGEGGDNNPGGSRPASECGGEQSAEERGGEKFEAVGGTSNRDYAKLGPDDEYKEALSKNKQDKFGAHRSLEPGTPVALRIDIPAYNSTGKYVVTVHKYTGGKSVGTPIGYDSIVRLSGEVVFASNEKGAETILTGESNKYPLATVKGKFDASRELPEDFESWTPVGYNPKTAAYFYDKRTGDEITGGKDAISVGNTVFIRVPDIGERNAKQRYKAFARWMGLTKGGPGSGNFGHCGGEGGKDNPGGSRPAGECGTSTREPLEVPEYPESSRDLRKLKPDEEWKDSSGTRRVTVFHFSKEDRSQTGLKRGFAGTAAAGEERASMEYENGRLKPESAVIHAYLYGAKREKIVPGNVMHKIETTMSVLDVGSDTYQSILEGAQKEAAETGRPKLAIAREQAVIRGYDALVSQRHGIMQILRDVEPSLITVITREGEIGYEIKPSQDYVDAASKRYNSRMNVTYTKPRDDFMTLNRIADDMYDYDAISSSDKAKIVGSLTTDDLNTIEDVHAIRDKLLAAITDETPEHLRKEFEDDFKYSLLAGKTVDVLKAEAKEQRNEILQNSRVAIRQPLHIAKKIFEAGRFKSQFETGKSQGALNENMRRDVEKNSMGVPFKIEDHKRPIYGYASNEHGSHGSIALDGYGDVAYILKDEIKSRSTVTFGDSLDNALPASPFNNHKEYSVAPHEPGRISRATNSYIEAQFHGGVSVNDVDRIVINTGTAASMVRKFSGSLPDIIKGARDYNIPIFVAMGNEYGTKPQRSMSLEEYYETEGKFVAELDEPAYPGSIRKLKELRKLLLQKG